MKKRLTAVLAAVLVAGMMIVPTGAITTGKWDFQAGLDYAQGVIDGMPEYAPLPVEPEIPVELEEDCPGWVKAAKQFLSVWLACWNGILE